jgi:hypothetical protein
VRENTMAIMERETSGKMKVIKITLTGQYEAKLKKGKDGRDVALNAPVGDDKIVIREGMKSLSMH